MTTLELMQAVSAKAIEVKQKLTKSYFSGDKKYFNDTLSQYPFCENSGDIYDTIGNLSAKVARDSNY
jgi:hypothetical protein